MPLVFFILYACTLLSSAALSAEVNPERCFANGWTKDRLAVLADTPPPSDTLQPLALQLRHCLASYDPLVRDKTAFTLLSAWMRDNRLTVATRTTLFTQLTGDLQQRQYRETGVYLPFALLALSEVLRTDRITAFLDDGQRNTAVKTVATYLAELDDYRGFSEDAGWRHSVAHASDVYLQLALNEHVTASHIHAMAQSVARQVNPAFLHFYQYGESQRLARATAYLMLRDAQPLTFWQNWLAQVASPSPFDQWGEVFNSQQGLAKRHNTRAFLLELQQLIAGSENARLQALSERISVYLTRSA